MATKKEVKEHLKIALKEIGRIKPWFDEEVEEWIFCHPNYPVEYSGSSPEQVVKNYPKYLEVFIQHRLDSNVDELMEKNTKGKGGARAGAGRPKGTKKEQTKQIRVPVEIADWLKYPGVIQYVQAMLKSFQNHANR